MHMFHGSFQRKVNKVAFEYFNQAVIRTLADMGVANPDLASVAQFLDGFRSRVTGATPSNVVCQDPDCATSPFSIQVAATYFNPAYLTVPHGTVLVFTKEDLTQHIVSEVNSTTVNVTADGCLAASKPALDIDLTGVPQPQSSDPVTRPFTYFDEVRCRQNDADMTGQIAVHGAAAVPVASVVAVALLVLAQVLA